MSETGQYLLSVICTGMACGIGVSVSEGSEGSHKLIKMLSGMIICLICISPLLHYDFRSVQDLYVSAFSEAEIYAEEGERLQTEQIQESIKKGICTYIERAAMSNGTQLKAEVEMDGNVINTIDLFGKTTPNQRRRITRELIDAFEIEDDQIKWNP